VCKHLNLSFSWVKSLKESHAASKSVVGQVVSGASVVEACVVTLVLSVLSSVGREISVPIWQATPLCTQHKLTHGSLPTVKVKEGAVEAAVMIHSPVVESYEKKRQIGNRIKTKKMILKQMIDDLGPCDTQFQANGLFL